MELLDLKNEIDSLIKLDVNAQIEKAFILSLKSKGFEFENKSDFIDFIKENVTCIDNQFHSQRIYQVRGVDFLMHDYKESLPVLSFEDNNVSYISIDFGRFFKL